MSKNINIVELQLSKLLKDLQDIANSKVGNGGYSLPARVKRQKDDLMYLVREIKKIK